MSDKQSNPEKAEKLAHDILILSRNTLLVNLRFLDLALSELELIPVKESTLLTDSRRIFYNPKHILKNYLSAREIPVRDYLHVVFHCVFKHMYGSYSMDRACWDLACDIAVENTILELGLKAVSAPREQTQAKFLNEMKKQSKQITAEKVYAGLQQMQMSPDRLAEIRALFYADNHEIWYMTRKQTEAMLGISLSGQRTVESHSALSEVWSRIAERMQVDMETFGKKQGFLPGAMIQNLSEVNREKYDYSAFLKKFAVMGEAMKINYDEFDYVFYTYGLQLYEKMPLVEPLEYKEIKAIKEFVIAIDTSGSTAGELVQKFIQKTYNILKSTESFFTKINLHIIQCDADIQEDKKIACDKDFDEYLKTMKIRGLGGTDFRPVFSYVENLRKNKEFNNLKGLIYFTDGYGTFPAQKPAYETAFVFLDDEQNNYDVPPWAIKLILQKNEV